MLLYRVPFEREVVYLNDDVDCRRFAEYDEKMYREFLMMMYPIAGL